jgi:hypothetical protein
MGSATGVEYALELPAAADSPGGWQSIGRHSGPLKFDRPAVGKFLFARPPGANRKLLTRLPRSGDREALPPFGAATGKDLTALLRRHADQESVGPFPVPPVRLKCADALRHDY